jgi:ABC-type amino acid transport substrate-binding protein
MNEIQRREAEKQRFSFSDPLFLSVKKSARIRSNLCYPRTIVGIAERIPDFHAGRRKDGMRKYTFLLTLCFLVCFAALTGFPQARPAQARPTPAQRELLRVGVYHAPPFAIETENGWDGIAVHLWRDAAEAMGVAYEWRPIEPERTADSLAAGEVDVVITAVANAEDEAVLDFSQSYFVSTVGFAEPSERGFLQIAGALFSPRFWRIAMWLAVALLLVGVTAWLFERNTNEEQFGGGVARGIWAGFWWAGVTMSTIGYGDKAPVTVGGRIVALIWMLVAMGVTATLTASLTSVLALSPGLGATQFPHDLYTMNVGSVADSESANFLQKEGIQFQSFAELRAGMEAVSRRQLDVFVHDAAALRFVNGESLGGGLHIRETGFLPQHHAFALPAGSLLREPLNAIILRRIGETAWKDMVARYLQ